MYVCYFQRVISGLGSSEKRFEGNVLCRGNNKYEGFEIGVCLIGLWNSQEFGVVIEIVGLNGVDQEES